MSLLKITKDKTRIMIELHPKEIELINRIRTKYRWGEILVETRDGLPIRIGKTTVYDSL